jgi:hypothetical protein
VSRLAAFAAGIAVALAAPALADDVRLHCQPVIEQPVKCDPTALRYNRAPLACRVS